jgi:hypothetical protein
VRELVEPAMALVVGLLNVLALGALLGYLVGRAEGSAAGMCKGLVAGVRAMRLCRPRWRRRRRFWRERR